MRTLDLSSLKERRLRGIFTALCNLLRRGNGVGDADLFLVEKSNDRMNVNDTKLRRGKFRLDIRKKNIYCKGDQTLKYVS